MSGGLKSIGKTFKKVLKVVKKIALPALAIGAIALTGGAAAGIIPSLGSLGLSPALTGILSTAGKGALTGALGAAVSGKNILKGATGGALVGGALGGVGALTGGIGNVGASAAGGAPTAATGATAASGAVASGISGATAAGGGGFLGGIGGFINRNPTIVGNLLDGVGSGLIAAQADKETKRQEAQERANFGGFAGSPNFAIGAPQTQPAGQGSPPSTGRPFIEFDAKLGRLVTRGG